MKMTKHVLPVAATLAALILFGAGCGSGSSAVQNASSSDDYSYATSTDHSAVSSTPDLNATTSTATSTPATSTSMNDSTNSSSTLAFPGILPAAQVNKKIRIHTNMGDIVIQLMADQGPRAASNFIYLVQHHFYDGTMFHRVIPGFMIQGGDPLTKDPTAVALWGTGGPGYQFDNDPVNSPYTDGIVAMANAGPNTNGSQFFIMVHDYDLSPDYSIFGKVISGLDVAHKIADVPRNGDDRPLQDVKMISVTVEK